MNLKGFGLQFYVLHKKTALSALCFFLGLGVYAGGVNDPALHVTTASPTSRQIALDWSKVKPAEGGYGLYRANRAEKTISLVKEINSGITQVVDSNLPPPLVNYYYFVTHIAPGKPVDPVTVFPNGKKITEEEMAAQLATIPWNLRAAAPSSEPQRTDIPASAPVPPPSGGARTGQRLNDGIYIGLALFSNKVDAPAALVPLDPAGRRELLERLNVRYTPSRSVGTALYYAEHTVLENLSALDKQGELPQHIETVSVITFTDGLDTASTDVELPAPGGSVSFAGKQTSSYMNYVSQQIKSRRVSGKKIDAWAIGIPGKDVTNEAEFARTLESVSSSPDHVAYLNDLSQIEERLRVIADDLNIWTPVVNLTFTVPAYPVGTIVRLTFDGYYGAPEGSARYIEGRIAHDGKTGYSLTALSASGMTLAHKTPVDGKRTTEGIEYTITLHDNFSESTLMQWYKQPGYAGNEWQLNSEVQSKKVADFTNARRSALIYLVLDCSSSLSELQVNEIRRAVTRFIERLFDDAASAQQIAAQNIVSASIPDKPRARSTENLPYESPAQRPYQEEKIQYQQQSPPPAQQQRPQPKPAPAPQPSPPSQPYYEEIPGYPQYQQQDEYGQYQQQPPRYDQTPPPYYQQQQQPPRYPSQQQQQQGGNQYQQQQQQSQRQQPPYRPQYQQPQYQHYQQPQYQQPATRIEIYDEAGGSITITPPGAPGAPATLFLPAPTVNLAEPYSGFWVQVGSFTGLTSAQQTWRKLYHSNCPNAEIFGKNINGIMHYRVKIGPYQDRRDAEKALNTILYANIGFNDAYIVRQ